MNVNVRTPLSAPEARVALRGVESQLRSHALIAELDGETERADGFRFNADLLKVARETWEHETGGFE